MGRAKVSLNLIPNPKSRVSTFKKRKNSLMKKAYELSTLCDVPVCVLIHGPDHDDHHHQRLHTWPPDPTHVRALLRACTTNPNLHKRKSFDLSDYFEDRRAKLLADTCKLRQKHQSLCPNPTETYLDCLNQSQLRAFMDSLDSKLEAVSAMLELMEPNQLLPLIPPFSPQDDSPLLQSPFVEDDPDQIGLCFDHLPSLFPQLHHNTEDFKHSKTLINNEFHYNFEDLVMPGKDEFEFEFARNDEVVYDTNLTMMMMPRKDELEFEFARNDEAVYDTNLTMMMMPRKDELELEFARNDEAVYDTNLTMMMMPRKDELEFEFARNDEAVYDTNLMMMMMMPGNDEFSFVNHGPDLY